MSNLPTPEQFLTDFTRDLAQDRANTSAIIKGYAVIMALREEAIRAEASDLNAKEKDV